MERYKNKKVCVTGGAGFVGSNLVEALVREGASVIIVDDLFTGDVKHLDNVPDKYTLFLASVNNDIREIVSKVDIVFHLAARNIIASTKNPRSDFETNAGGTLNILMAAREYGFKVVYTSSASVYGNSKYLPINEDDHINLLTPYAVSKFAGEGYCMAFNESYDIPVAVLRLSNVYGPHQSSSNPYCGVVAKFMDSALKKEPINIHGDGLSTRDFTYVEDVVEALMLAGLSPKADGEVFNVATGIETSILDLAKAISQDSEIKLIDRRDIDNIRRRVLNIEKIRRKLGWMPKFPLQAGLQKTKETLCEPSVYVSQTPTPDLSLG